MDLKGLMKWFAIICFVAVPISIFSTQHPFEYACNLLLMGIIAGAISLSISG